MNRTWIAFVLLIFALTACGQTVTPVPMDATSQVGIANPASVFCEANAGKLDIRTGPDGGQIGMCVFADGSECEEWAHFRGECKPGATPGTTTTPASQPAQDIEPIALTVLAPQDGDIVNAAQIQLNGTTSPDAVVTVNDEILIAGSDGAFQTTVTLDEGVNLIEVVASNATGGETFVDLTVTYQP